MPTDASSKFVQCSPSLNCTLGAIGSRREEEYGEIGGAIRGRWEEEYGEICGDIRGSCTCSA